MILDNNCWGDFRADSRATAGRPCLFLDRDGVVVEDVGHLHRATDLELVAGAAGLIRAANDTGWLCGLVTNQSGIARGLFTWADFVEVQAELDRRLGAAHARLDFVVACPFVNDPDADGPGEPLHAWRKPNPGMFRAVIDHYRVDAGASIMIGDKLDDLIAADVCGIGRLIHVLTGHGRGQRDRVAAWLRDKPGGLLCRSVGDPKISSFIKRPAQR